MGKKVILISKKDDKKEREMIRNEVLEMKEEEKKEKEEGEKRNDVEIRREIAKKADVDRKTRDVV